MNVAASGASSSMHMKQMDGSGKGGANSMRDTMRALAPEDRAMMQEQMATLSQADKKTIKEQLGQIDKTSLSSEDLKEMMISMISSFQSQETQSTSSTTLDTYA